MRAAAPPLDEVVTSLEAAVGAAPTVKTAAAAVASETEMLGAPWMNNYKVVIQPSGSQDNACFVLDPSRSQLFFWVLGS